jgi:hypothetical protein
MEVSEKCTLNRNSNFNEDLQLMLNVVDAHPHLGAWGSVGNTATEQEIR